MRRLALIGLMLIMMNLIPYHISYAEDSSDPILSASANLYESEISYHSIEAFANELDNVNGFEMQIGNRGAVVECFQSLLVESGYLDASYVPGLYGATTSSAVEAFQSASNIDVTGKASLATQFLLVSSIAEFQKIDERLIAEAHGFGVIIFPDYSFYIGALENAGTDLKNGTIYPSSVENTAASTYAPNSERATISESALLTESISYKSVGESVMFGSYEQDNDFSNGAEPIEWIIISKESNKITLLSKYNLVCKKYNETWANITWESCTLRTWLNSEFLETAFSDVEMTCLAAYPTTSDYVYILSASEWNSTGIAEGTDNTVYAIAAGVYNDNGKGWSWLRDNGIDLDHAQEIDCTGSVNSFGSFVDCDNEGVRPVIIVEGGNEIE